MNLHAMVSLPSVVVVGVTATLKLHPQFRKYPPTSFPIDKGQSISLQKTHISTHLDPNRNLKFQEAFSLAKESNEEVDSSFYPPLLQQCLENCSFSSTQIIHCHIVKTGSHEDPFLSSFLVTVYAKCGRMECAQQVFDHMNRRNAVAWTNLMKGYVQNSMPKHAIHLFEEMLLHSECYPSNYTLAIALNACTSLHSLKLGEQLHAYIIKYHVDFDTSIGNALCSLYTKCGGKLEVGLTAFRRIKEKDVISWTAAISACGEKGEAMKGVRVFVEMLLDEVQVQPNEYTLTSALSQCCEVKCLELGIQVHALCTKLGYESNLRVRNSLLYLYLKCGCIVEAQRLFKGMNDVNLVTWNAMIAGHAQMMELSKDNLSAYQKGIEALNLFSKLNRSGMKPDPFTFSSVLSVCSKMMALEQGEQIHARTIKTGFLSDVVVGSSMINMYNKCGSIERASKVFLEMSIRTMILWTTMITGFAQHGWSKQALNLFEDMKLVGIRPNLVTFVGVLSACGSAGMVNEAFNYFEIMQKEYKIKPVMDHYVCLVDMLVRLGQVQEAFDLIKKMDYKASEFIWSNLIVGCLSQGNLELGCDAAEKLLSLKPKDTETYKLLLNAYVSAGRYDDVSRVENIMREEKIGELKDWSWISIKDRVYSFQTNDKADIESSIGKSLEDLHIKAKNLGYEMLEYVEKSDKEKEKTSSPTIYHSEKLAITFGLENLPNSSPVRVVKNTLMCRDSHNFVKYISTLTSREIIVKDSKRLHKFVNGQCSCGNIGGFL
ncbi:putative tetratricopeptide-like helical domain, DYW domain-containing protein [Medicago truncatula]|uniref:Pentatricopeptide (PPR) repeat protein n=1 Tax=Medicago truncatula TaxID=3880 RepID=G7K5Z9_MEDTR|nr:putative pentatricopeptide repeat-containing protein At3g13770, mitochondrial [Medicago truncatula]AES98329.2 pentatricopeptide (PPR) repeat protein [Medicago truncatula]RHN56305.1 putative tetratricopeptide-like helical domain, DYW domain-containing protein [Medicago truncatula]